MARRGRELPRFFTFGDRVPAVVGVLLSLMLAATLLARFDRGLGELARLSPEAILRGEAWRLVTWPFVQGDALDLIFVGFMFWWLGQQLAFAWSERRLLLRFLGFAVFPAIAKTLLYLVWAPAGLPHVGAWPVVNALLVSWAMLYPERQVNLYGVLPLTGRSMALLVTAGTALFALFGGTLGIGAYTPHLFAVALAWALSRGRIGSPWRDAKQWWGERETRRRARHLKVVRKDTRDDDRPRWMN